MQKLERILHNLSFAAILIDVLKLNSDWEIFRNSVSEKIPVEGTIKCHFEIRDV